MQRVTELFQKRRLAITILAAFVLMAIAIPGSQLLSQSDPPPVIPRPLPPGQPTWAPPTEAPPQEAPATEDPAPQDPAPADPTPEGEATEETAPVTEAPPQPAPVTEEATPDRIDPPPDVGIMPDEPLEAETFCQMNITNGGDDDPFTYDFQAINTANIASFAWDFGNPAAPVNTATTQNASHTFTAADDYTITLECVEEAAFGGTILILTGQITISNNPVADFTLTPNTGFTGLPATVGTVNQSEGQGLTYAWSISTSATPGVDVFHTETAENFTFTFDEALFLSVPGLDPDAGATIYYHLTVTDTSGANTNFVYGIGYLPAPPLANFTLDPSTGEAPLTVTVEGVDLNEGPIDTWTWNAPGSNELTATGIGPHTFTYATAGTYTITLNYGGISGGGSASKQVGVFPTGAPIQAIFSVISMETLPGGDIEVCFSNDSTGPVVTSEWDFDNDGTVDLISNAEVVCNIYTVADVYTVHLEVFDGGTPVATSNTTLDVNLTNILVADFNINPGDVITLGTDINLVDTSNGSPVSWSWDWNGDGVADSTQQNPTGISLTTLGSHPIRLTVTNAIGLTSFVEKIVMVERLELTCGINGNTAVIAGSAAQNYTSIIGNDGGRAITYEWLITGTGNGIPMTLTTQDINLDWDTIGFGAFQITLTANTADGSECTATTTVNHSHPALNCEIITDLPAAPIYNTGATYNFSADIANMNLNGRAYTIAWSTGDAGDATTFTPPGPGGPYTVRYDVTVNNGTGYTPATSTCFEEITFDVLDWPTLTCNNITGPANPEPGGTTYTYRGNVGGAVAGYDITYTWNSVGNITSANPRVNNNAARINFDASIGELANTPPAIDDLVEFSASITYPDGTPGGLTRSCGPLTRNVAVTIPNLVCNAPTGDMFPIVGDPEIYSVSVGNIFSRATTADFADWEFEILNGAVWDPVVFPDPDGFDTLDYTFLIPDAQYRLRYHYSVDAAGGYPGDVCTSPYTNITVYGAGVGFQCESSVVGNLNPVNEAGTYAYTIDVDNGTGLNLRYTWTLTHISSGAEYTLATFEATTDGIVSSPAFTLAELAPDLVDHYNLRVLVEEVSGSVTHTCAQNENMIVGEINVEYGYTIGGGWTNTALPIDELICFNNISSAVPGDISTLGYNWTISGDPSFNSLGVSAVGAQDLPDTGCFSFSEPGTYTVELYGENASGLMSDSHTVTYNVYGLQSINIDRTGQDFVGTPQDFTANGVNITLGYTWEFEHWDGAAWVPAGAATGQTPTRSFATPGDYRATVIGEGNLGFTEASLEFTLIGSNNLSAGFIPSPFGGIAPLEVCFTDTSISGTPILSWEWDFDGDGNIDLSYDNNNIPAQICHTYPDPGMVYTASLYIENASFPNSASNNIRTYNLLEISANFGITPMGGRTFCFTEQNPADVSVTGWTFGDGNVAGAVDQVCHTYAADGTYAVEMSVTNGPLTGTVVRPVVVILTSGTPVIGVTGTCAADTTATFTVTNTGDAMTTPDQVTIRDNNGNVILIAPLQLGANDSTQYNVSGYVGTITLTAADNITATADTDCVEPPVLNGNATCAIDGTATFTINNTSSATAASQTYQILDAGNNVVDSGTINVPVNGMTTVSVSGVWGPLTFTSEDATYGPTATLNVNSNCATPPLLNATHLCELDGTAVFTVTNTSPDTPASQNYTVTTGGGQVVDSGVLNLAVNGGSQEIRITNIYGPLTLTSSGPQGVTTEVNESSDCDQPPILRVVPSCSDTNTAIFAVFNDSADSTANQTYQILDEGNNVVDSGTLNIAPSAQQNILIPNATGVLTMISSGLEGPTTEIDISTTCNAAPVLTGEAICAADGSTTFAITNISSVNAASQPYEVVNSVGTIVTSGTLTVAPSSTTEINVPGSLGPLTFTSVGAEGATTELTINSNCGEPPVLTATSVCNGDTTTFVVTNSSTSAANQPYEIRNQANVLVSSGTLSVVGGGSQEINLTGDYGPLTFTSTGLTTVTASSDCQNIETAIDGPITGMVVCAGDGMVNFIITNNGSVEVNQIYTITTPGGEQAGGGILNIGVGGSATFTVETSGTPLTFTTGGDAGSLALTVDSDCTVTTYITGEPGTTPPTDGTVPRISTTPPFPSYLPQLDLIPRADTSVLERPAWNPITIGGAVCVDWLIYHTNMTGDWEIFRLGDDNGRLAQYDPNLSQGRGEDVVDMAPTRSPDNEWIAFTSNRDSTPEEENWELYVARVDNSEIRRVTYNTFAKDIDPAWSPDGRYLVFETDRDGNWELYLLDLATGAETRLTDSPYSDVNAFWAPDSKTVAFQSDRDGLWQIYTIDIATGEETLMSDGSGEDHDPAFSFEGDRILFRSYRESGNSTIYVMDADGQNVTQLSDPRGNASNHTWSPDDSVIAYQSDLDGDLDIYAYEVEDKETRLVTDNNIHDYAPTWYCDAPLIVFTSDVVGDPNIFNTPALPIEAPAILVDREASQMTFDPADDVYPENNPAEENASREGNVPPRIGLE